MRHMGAIEAREGVIGSMRDLEHKPRPAGAIQYSQDHTHLLPSQVVGFACSSHFNTSLPPYSCIHGEGAVKQGFEQALIIVRLHQMDGVSPNMCRPLSG
mmetsp:Transcript_20592/g.52941  ORF Transcript_20592/g.52941 Transcript_20592/m.52941 type:complete len:99 (-) Transcript_20592:2509-2805(-)